MQDTNIYSVGLSYASVCTSGTNEEARAHLDAQYPTGLDHGWSVSSENFATGEPNPSPCDTDPDTHRHILFDC